MDNGEDLKENLVSNSNMYVIEINQFIDVVDSIYGMYLDASAGFHFFKQQFELCQIQAQQATGLSVSELDSKELFFGQGPPRQEWSSVLHRATQGEIKERNQKNGKNQQFFGNMCVVSIYHYWEDTFRGRLAEFSGKDLKDIKADIFGDIRFLRIDIIHRGSIATRELSDFKILKWFRPGETITFSEDQFHEIVAHIKEYLFLLRDQRST